MQWNIFEGYYSCLILRCKLTQILAILLGDPWFWGRAWAQLKEFDVFSLVGLSILDFHLLAEWLEKHEGLGASSAPCYYIDIRTLDKLCHGSTESSLRSHFLFPVDKIPPKKPVFLLLENCPSYGCPLLLVLNFEKEKALFLGVSEDRRIYSNPEWLDTIWDAVGRFFGWESQACRHIIVKDWIPVCFFCFQWQNSV